MVAGRTTGKGALAGRGSYVPREQVRRLEQRAEAAETHVAELESEREALRLDAGISKRVASALRRRAEAAEKAVEPERQRGNRLSLALNEHNGKIGEQRRRAEAAEARAKRLAEALAEIHNAVLPQNGRPDCLICGQENHEHKTHCEVLVARAALAQKESGHEYKPEPGWLQKEIDSATKTQQAVAAARKESGHEG